MPDDFPCNDLERALAATRESPAAWLPFYRCLRESVVVVGHLPDPDDAADENGVPRTLRVPMTERYGEKHTTWFTSTERAIAWLGPDVPRFRISVAGLFIAGEPTATVLNAGHRSEVSLPRDLVAAIADETIFDRPAVRTIETTSLGALYFSAPPRPQTHLTQALVTVFAKRTDVVCAHLAWMTNDGTDPPHAVIGIEASGAFEPLAVAVDAALKDVSPPHEIVTFLPMDNSQMCARIRAAVKPFFVRSAPR